MAGGFDFSGLDTVRDPYAHGVDAFAALASSGMDLYAKRKLAEEQQAKLLAFHREQEGRRLSEEQAREGLKERRFVGEQKLKNEDRRRNVEDSIRQAVAGGDMAKAQILGRYAEMDPSTGNVSTQNLFQELPQPARPNVPSLEEGPQSTPQISEDSAIIRAQQNPQGPPAAGVETLSPEEQAQGGGTMSGGDVQGEFANLEAERNRRATEVPTANDALTQQYTKGVAASQTHPVRIGDTQTTAEDLRYSAGKQNLVDFDKVGAQLMANANDAYANGDQLRQEQALRQLKSHALLRQGVETGAMPLSKAVSQVMAGDIGENKRDLSEWTQRGNWQLGEDKAKLAADAAAGKTARAGASGDLAQNKFDFAQQQEKARNVRKDVKTFKEVYNAKTTQEAAQEFPNIVTMLNSGNGKLQEQALITMMRLAQKDNRFSDADAKMAMRTGAGWLDQAESWFDKGATGEMGPGVIDAAARAARQLNGFYQAKSAKMNEDADSFLQDPMYDPKEAASILGRELPGFKARHPEMFGGRRVGEGGGPVASPQSGPADASNPDDANGPGANQPLQEDPNAGEIDQITGEGTGRGRVRANDGYGGQPGASDAELRRLGGGPTSFGSRGQSAGPPASRVPGSTVIRATPVGGGQAQDEQTRAALKWVADNPGDPRGPAILRKLGYSQQ